MTRVAAVVAAAGSGVRLGGSTPKALRLLGDQPLLVRAVAALRAGGVDEVVVVAPEAYLHQVGGLVPGCLVLRGGATRQQSVLNGLTALSSEAEIVLVHDAARALAPASLVARVIAAVESGHDAVIPGLGVTDTIKTVDGLSVVVGTVDRRTLRAIQTPQGFRRALLEQAHAGGPSEATDDAALVEQLGKSVYVVDGDRLALKITTPEDLVIAAALLEGL